MHKMIERVVLLLVGAAIGLGTYTLTQSNTAHAAAQESYKVVQLASTSKLETTLNSHAAQGWSYAGSIGGIIILKR